MAVGLPRSIAPRRPSKVPAAGVHTHQLDPRLCTRRNNRLCASGWWAKHRFRSGLSAEERVRFHQEHSRPVMEALHAWMKAQFTEKRVEPNSGLGSAIAYCLKHWDRLTLFLRQAGAPLDNNLVERALKKSVLHRKNSLFYKAENGAEVGDIFTSLIQLNGANPFDYLIELHKHVAEVTENPSAWMPLDYEKALNQLTQNVGFGLDASHLTSDGLFGGSFPDEVDCELR
jgi:hypothetical protein